MNKVPEAIKTVAKMRANAQGRGWRQNLVDFSFFAMESNFRIFGTGIFIGAAFEIFKNHFTIGETSFYKVFIRNNLQRELDDFEEKLKQREQRIIKSIEKLKEEMPDEKVKEEKEQKRSGVMIFGVRII